MDTALLISAGIALAGIVPSRTNLCCAHLRIAPVRSLLSIRLWVARTQHEWVAVRWGTTAARRELREPARDRLCGPTLSLRARSRPRGVIRRALEPASRLLRFLARLARRGDQHPPGSGV